MRLRRHDDERNDRHLRARQLEAMVQPCQGLDEHVHAFVPVLVSARGKEVERVVGVEIDMAIKVPSDEIVNLLFRLLMEILKFVHGGELLHVQSVGNDAIGLPLQEVLAFIGGDVGDGGEDVRGVRGGPFDAISMIDPSFAGLGVDIKVL